MLKQRQHKLVINVSSNPFCKKEKHLSQSAIFRILVEMNCQLLVRIKMALSHRLFQIGLQIRTLIHQSLQTVASGHKNLKAKLCDRKSL